MKHRYLVVIEKGENNYSAYAPDVPGCIGIGQTPDEALESYKESLQLYFDTPNLNGNPIPTPYSVAAEFVEVEVDVPTPVGAARAS